jgi:biopolymer transport protein ExbB
MTISGGPVFWLLLVMAVAALIVFMERFFELRRAQIDYQDFVKGIANILSRGNEDEAIAMCEDAAVPVARIVATAIRNRNGSESSLRESVDSQGRAEASYLNRRLATLALIGTAAPLLGLLGTIIGFIKTMLLVNADAIVSRANLVGAAMESLVSAAVGLAVAVSASVMFGMLRLRMERLVVEMEAAASQIVGYLTSKEGE